jgi:hypothetical protein
MKLQKILWPVLGVVLVAAGWRGWGWPGVALAVGGIVMWMLLYFTRVMRVLQRAADRPLGYCDSAVMLNAKLKRGVNLLHVIAMTRALGESLGEPERQPEVFRWADSTGSSVRCEFLEGKLVKWELARPTEPGTGASPAP